MADPFLQRSAADVMADPRFEQFLEAFQQVAGSEHGFVRKAFFEASGGTTADVLRRVLTTSSRRGGADDLDEAMEDTRNAVARPIQADIEQRENELAQLKADLAAWLAFIE